jgi:putative (di)nucleoside polyphosphate hydrolase
MTLTDADLAALPYRPCVGLMLLNREGLIFAGQRIDNPADAWQMPQGGIDAGESPREAALRELAEEVGLAPARVEVLRESAVWLPYDLPRALVPRLWQGRFRGQTQRWFAMRFPGSDEAINIGTDEPEFRAWAWMRHDDLMGKIVPFKRDIYARVFDEFADLIGRPAPAR